MAVGEKDGWDTAMVVDDTIEEGDPSEGLIGEIGSSERGRGEERIGGVGGDGDRGTLDGGRAWSTLRVEN